MLLDGQDEPKRELRKDLSCVSRWKKEKRVRGMLYAH